MNRPFKTLSTTALAAVLAASALVPAASAAPTTQAVSSLDSVIVSLNGENVKISLEDYANLLELGKIQAASVKYVQTANGNNYTLADYSDYLDLTKNVNEAAGELEDKGNKQTVSNLKEGTIVNGEIVVSPVTEDFEVTDIAAINKTGVTVNFPKLTADINGATIAVKDPAGNVVNVVAQNLKAGDTSATFPFAVVPEEVTVGNWTVDGKTFNVVSTDASFSDLTTDVGLWNNDFQPSTLTDTYTLFVENNTTKVNFTPKAAAGSTITANVTGGSSVAVPPTDMTPVNQVIKNGESNTIALNTKANDTKIVFTVIAPDGKSSKTYTVNVAKAAASANDIATLSALSAPGVTSSFASNTTSYSTTVPNGTSTYSVTPTATDAANSKILVNGELVTSGSPKGVDLSVGDNKIEVKVIAADNKTSKTYTIDVKRAAITNSTSATLNSLTLSAGELVNFTPDGTDNSTKQSLTAKVPNTVEDLTMTPVASNANSTISVTAKNASDDLEVVKSGNAFTIKDLKEGGANVVSVKVTSPDATQNKEYELTVTRAAATDSDIANLSNILFDTTNAAGTPSASTSVAGFNATTTSYSASVANDQEKFALAVTEAANSTVSVELNGEKISNSNAATGKLVVGKNVIKVKVIAQNAANSRTYTYEVNRASSTASTDADLKEINSSKGKLVLPAKNTDVANGSHIATLATNETDFSITPLAKDANAAISVIAYKGDKTATSKTALMALGNTDKLTVEKNGGTFNVKGLTSGDTSVFVLVEAEDGSTSEVYEVLVNKAAVNASDAAKITTAPTLTGASGALTVPAVVDGKTDYTVQAKFADTTIKYAALTPGSIISAGATAEVKVNGNVVAATKEAPLNVGANTVTVTVTAADGKTKTVYTYTVNRTAEGASSQAGLTEVKVDKGSLVFGSAGNAIKDDVTSGTTNASTATLSIPNVNSVVVTPVKADEKSTVTITSTDVINTDGVQVTPNANGTFTVANLDDTEQFEIKVTSENGLVEYATTVTVDKVSANASSIAELGGLSGVTLTPGFDKDKFTYESYVANTTDKVTLTPTGIVGTVQSYEVNGVKVAPTAVTSAGTDLPLVAGQKNVIKVNVLAADRATVVTYTVNVNRAAATAGTVATLNAYKDLTNDKFITVADSMASTVAKSGDAYRFMPTTTDAGATVTATAAKDVGSAAITVVKNTDGSFTTAGITEASTITVKVTAADKVTTKTYTVNVTVAP